MTMVRRYVFAFVAVCLAFAGGVALGNGPLQGDTPVSSDTTYVQANATLKDRLASLQADQTFTRALDDAAGPALVAGTLKNTSVAILVLPGVAGATVSDVTAAVTAAGGEIVISGHLTQTLVDPGKKTYVDSVATNSLHGLKDLGSAASLSTYQRIGALFARAYTGSGSSLAVDEEATRIDAQLQGAKLLTLRTALERRANAVVVLGPGDHGDSDSVYAVHQIESQIVTMLAGGCDGLLLAGPTTASLPGGLIDTVTSSSGGTAIATLNVVDTAAGRTVAVAALADALTGQPGTYGMANGIPALPPSLSSP
jgi:hypothetical protein